MSRNYKFHNPEGLYFVSFTHAFFICFLVFVHPLRSSAVVGWLDVFTRNEYKDLVVESLEFCQQKKRNGNSCMVYNDQSHTFNF